MSMQGAHLHTALAIPERLPIRQFAQFLRRCAIALRGRDENPFSEDEVQMMIEQFGLTPTEFDSMLSACIYILQQAACFSFDSGKVHTYSTQCGASEDVAGCFVAVWDTEGDELVESLKQRTIADRTLDQTAWRVDLKAAEKSTGPTRDPLVLLDMSISGQEPVTIQFDHAALSKLYAEIEQIQEQVDKLT